MVFTNTGPMAKIDGVWYSVNGSAEKIIEVRYPLSKQELELFDLVNDTVN